MRFAKLGANEGDRRMQDARTLLPRPNAAEELERTRVLQIETILAGNAKILLTGLLGSFLMALAVWTSSEHESLRSRLPWVWWVLLACGLGRGAWMAIRFNAATHSAEDTLREGDRLLWNGLYCAIAWGAASWLMLPAANPQIESFVIIATAMVFMGGAGVQAVYRPVLYSFIFPATITFSLGLLRFGGMFYSLLAFAFMLLAFVILMAARTQENAVLTAIRSGFEKEALLRERMVQQTLTEAAREEAEQAREQAEIADRGKTTFLAAAGHDLRQPMHALVQYYGHLKRKNRDPALDETISRIGKSIDAMQDLLDSVLEVSKLLMGAVRPHVSRFPMTRVLDRMDVQLRPIAEDKGLSLEVAACDLVVATDEILLERILRNLTLNAIRYTRSGGVLVRCKRVGQQLRVQVWDTGIGIPRSERSRIFEEFYQVGNEGRDRRKGLGLGLWLVRQQCELLALPLRLKSIVGKGSVFTIEVPTACRADAPAPDAEAGLQADFVRGAFVVVIDDDEESLHATSTSLRSFGCRVLAATSGMNAIERLQNQEFMPQLVISDYRLAEGETAIEAIAMLRENLRALFGADFEIAALVLSGDTAPAELLRVQDAGFHMLHKPLGVDELYDAVNDKLERLARSDFIAT
jgi:signal transduction histidine kinase/CheY-like chemotaxis protein